MTRSKNIAEELKSAAAAEEFTMPETLEECATAKEEIVNRVLRKIREGADPLPFARFFDVLYTDEDVTSFTDAFDEAAPEDYIQSSDLDSGSPWCMPWLWESDPLTAEEGDTPKSLARRYVEEHADYIRQAFRDWKEEECAQISQDIWEAYHGDREIPDEYIHQSELFGEAFDALDALGGDKAGADEIVDRYAEEIFYARA